MPHATSCYPAVDCSPFFQACCEKRDLLQLRINSKLCINQRHIKHGYGLIAHPSETLWRPGTAWSWIYIFPFLHRPLTTIIATLLCGPLSNAGHHPYVSPSLRYYSRGIFRPDYAQLTHTAFFPARYYLRCCDLYSQVVLKANRVPELCRHLSGLVFSVIIQIILV